MAVSEEIEAVIRKLSKAQRNALDQLATGQPGNMFHPKTITSLLDLELIEAVPRRDGNFSWMDYNVPIRVHIAWCNVASAEFDALSPEEQAAMEAPDAAAE
jgi:hypothetical protein